MRSQGGGAYTPQRSELPLSSKSRLSSPSNGTQEPEAGGCAAFRPLLVVSKVNLQVLDVAREFARLGWHLNDNSNYCAKPDQA